ncbi:MAG: SpoIVB peptidase, partial [Clostridia bacterium]|nr:SpoIVB peptidase [Clostridia bacterium]
CDPETLSYGALGHPITDTDTGTLMPVSGGSLLEAEIFDIDKGEKGEPGQLKGVFQSGKSALGTVSRNTDHGIFGTLYEPVQKAPVYPVASRGQVEEGPAVIYVNLSKNKVEEFDIEIKRNMGYLGGRGKDMVIHVTDPDLLSRTGGIVQGMSGSPIVQNGKLIGAVTHVFVNDPTRGYGIFIENMLAEAEKIK